MVRLLSRLPRGSALPAEVWSARHRGLLLVLLAHLIVLPAFAITQGWSFGSAWAFDAAPAAFGALACVRHLHRTLRSTLCAMALLSCSAVLVLAWHGTTEAHFHYFVTVGALALYEEWWAYMVAIVFVVVQHGAMAALNAETRWRPPTSSPGARASAPARRPPPPTTASSAPSRTRRSRWRCSPSKAAYCGATRR
jgi:hypothetical protein